MSSLQDHTEVRRLERHVDELKKDAKARDKEVENLERELGILERVGQARTAPKWLSSQPVKKPKRHVARPCLLLSDLHLDEVVKAREMMDINEYNRAIAEMRLRATFEGTVKITKEYWTGIDYDGFNLFLGGDIFSGNIHEELRESNEDTMLGSVLYWLDPVAEGISLLADEFGKVHVASVSGNHGRTTPKKQYKGNARANFDWFFAHALARMFEADKRVTFDVSEGQDLLTPIYGQKIMMTHGDQTGGGGGIGGIFPPIMRMNAKKSQRQFAVKQPYDHLLMGHWHQLIFAPGFIINGSLKGYDEFALGHNFNPEIPQQALWLHTPEHGITWQTPVIAGNRKAEGW